MRQLKLSLRWGWGSGGGVTASPFSFNQTNVSTFEIDGATGSTTVTVTAPPPYADYDAGNGAGIFLFDIDNLATGPIPLVPPQIIDDGSPADGETLTLTPGLWTYDPDNTGLTTPTYQWQSDAVDISGATSDSYTLTASESGTDVRVIETVTDSGGTRTATSAAVSVEPAAGTGPEDGLTLSTSFAPTTFLDTQITATNRTESVVFACDFTGLSIPTVGTGNGRFIMEHGGTGRGTIVAFDAAGKFIVRCGVGTGPTYPTGCAYIEVDSTDIGALGSTVDGTLVWEFDVTNQTARAWWNGTALGTSTGANTGDWTGADGGSYLEPAGSAGSFDTSQTGGLGLSGPEACVTYTTASDLRAYFNQVSAA